MDILKICICISVQLLITGIQACDYRCICSSGSICSECKPWYIYKVENGVANCNSQISSIKFAETPVLTALESGPDSLTVEFTRHDLPIAADATNYYFYSLEWSYHYQSFWKSRNRGAFTKHYNSGNPQQVTMKLNGLIPNRSYDVRLGLYRRVEYRAWENKVDGTDYITMTTTDYVWSKYGGNEYMESTVNGLQSVNLTQAASTCQNVGAELASIRSYEEYAFLHSLISSDTWIGLQLPSSVTDMSDCGYCDNCAVSSAKSDNEYCKQCIRCRAEWTWIDRSDMDFTFWYYRDPYSSSSSARCASLYPNYQGWLQRNCYYNKAFICKRAITDTTCPSHCECQGTDNCLSCEMWYVYQFVEGQGSCDLYVDTLQFEEEVKLTVVGTQKTSVEIEMRLPDFSIPEKSLAYYGYTLQYKLQGHTDDMYQNTGRFHQHSNNHDSISLSTKTLAPGTEYELRVALYRRLEVKGWQEILDATDSVTVTTLEAAWTRWHEYGYMFSVDNEMSTMDFDSAERVCLQNKAHLATVENSYEDDFLRVQHQMKTWIGLILPESDSTLGCDLCDECSKQENKSTSIFCGMCQHCRARWEWVDGSSVTYSAWHKEQPNATDRCAYSYINGWYAQSCSQKQHFVCKRAMNGSPIVTISTTTNELDAINEKLNQLLDYFDNISSNNSGGIGVMAGLAVIVVIAVAAGIIAFYLIHRRTGRSDGKSSTRAVSLQLRENRKKKEHVYENQACAKQPDGKETYEDLTQRATDEPHIYQPV